MLSKTVKCFFLLYHLHPCGIIPMIEQKWKGQFMLHFDLIIDFEFAGPNISRVSNKANTKEQPHLSLLKNAIV